MLSRNLLQKSVRGSIEEILIEMYLTGGSFGAKIFGGHKCFIMLETVEEVSPEAQYQYCTIQMLPQCIFCHVSSRSGAGGRDAESNRLSGEKAAREQTETAVEGFSSFQLKSVLKYIII